MSATEKRKKNNDCVCKCFSHKMIFSPRDSVQVFTLIELFFSASQLTQISMVRPYYDLEISTNSIYAVILPSSIAASSKIIMGHEYDELDRTKKNDYWIHISYTSHNHIIKSNRTSVTYLCNLCSWSLL